MTWSMSPVVVMVVMAGIVKGGPGNLECSSTIPAMTNVQVDKLDGDWHYAYLATDNDVTDVTSGYISISSNSLQDCMILTQGTPNTRTGGSYSAKNGVLTFRNAAGYPTTIKYHVLATDEIDGTSILVMFREVLMFGSSGGHEVAVLVRPSSGAPDYGRVFERVKPTLEAFCGPKAGDVTSYNNYNINTNDKCPAIGK